ncbi:circularly permuted type 2 ATP-grasp protein [Phormidium yuhuli AB48]|uniref:Circularly permuted type 2 ATP-grasp protein n=1 Tax=Phormidium yuhuli AB48 TaxID=2940671 RepID=A0ABY5ATW5_9CYAN|nr:circularly permuted type 2 ATP-grasp protein [Phormidium yuhuli]USR92288.1 circularly permuted type 2 ATP-grasp protein [Phormidium yuhuli AB48]
MKLETYDPTGYYDELFASQGEPRASAKPLIDWIKTLQPGDLRRSQEAAQIALFKLGVTFNVYSDNQGIEKVFPFDIIPRIISAQDWRGLEPGLRQRITALNLFLDDIYNEQRILNDGIVPRHIIESAPGFLKPCMGLKPPGGVWCHITGTDLVRDRDGQWYVLEDNLRVPSGISYVLENRRVLKSTFPSVFQTMAVQAIDDYPSHLLETLLSLAPEQLPNPTVAVLTPGIYNSAYYEHSFLAQQMGVELIEGRDLVVLDGYLQMRTTKGPRRVDVVYRRLDDIFLDPTAFNPDSLLGVPGLMDVYRAGRVALANAPGTGVADDKVVYSFVPEMIRYYLGEDPILPNVPTYLCWRDQDRDHVLQNLETLVVKSANEAGGYGMLVGSQSTAEERAEFAEKIKANPRNYIAQPILCLSQVPTLVGESNEIAGRHVDLRPYILHRGDEVYVHPGGLTRVALKEGSLVVNSSQGGGAKDTWVLME